MTDPTGHQALCNECGTLRVLATLTDTAGGTSQLGEPRDGALTASSVIDA